ncbi:MAG: tRNA (adenosine(37)-N6)-threonylcarbamoyltransferase complex dimerization subunit type 1 TsaB [Bacteroidetes bacterium]|nr:tRNA (adenosine(37)-N6)-threonylcarbamoyltransferase complex dimerization subunit type 1 TsaB [Bacteroidota bacterium]
MRILFLDASSRISETAFSENGKTIFHNILTESEGADMIVHELKRSFSEYGIDPGTIEYLSLSNGPGSFTGLRIGSSIAKGICFVTGCRLIELSTLDILANIAPVGEKIISLIPSNPKTMEYYYSEYEKTDGQLKRITEYTFGFISEIEDSSAVFITKQENFKTLKELIGPGLLNTSAEDLMKSQMDLTLNKITAREFTHPEDSIPVYIKEFIPKN